MPISLFKTIKRVEIPYFQLSLAPLIIENVSQSSARSTH